MDIVSEPDEINPDVPIQQMRRIGEAVRRFRKLNGLTQAEAARRAGVARTSLIALERGDRAVRVTTLVAVLEGCGYQIGFEQSPFGTVDTDRLLAMLSAPRGIPL